MATTNGTTNGSYVAISSTDDWKKFDNVCSSKGAWTGKSSGVTFFLTGDLDFTGVTGVTPVGVKYPYWNEKTEDVTTDFGFGIQAFQGTFDGNGYTIKNLDLSEKASDVGANSGVRGSNIGMGLFAIASNATFKNLIIEETCSFVQLDGDPLGGYCGAGALLGINSGNVVIDNVWNKGTVIGGVHAGGILGKMESTATVTNCTNDGDIKGANSKGGIVGWVSTLTVSNCINNGTIYGGGAGGIMGRTRGNAVATDCVNNGVILGVGNQVSGICAAVELGYSVTLTNCVNNAFFNLDYFKTADTTKCVKGIVNYNGSATMAEKVTVTNCTSVFDGLAAEDYATVIPASGFDLTRIGAFATWGANVVDLEGFDINATVGVEEENENGEMVTVNKNVYEITKYFKITSAAGLKNFSDLVNAGNTFGGKSVFLGMDIDMKGVTMMPIGNYTDANAACVSNVANGGKLEKATGFTGTFDGQGHTIDGLQMCYDSTETSSVALVGNNGGTIKNLILGPNCSFRMTGKADGYADVGAFQGRGGTITNCVSYATVYGCGNNAGGFSGRGGNLTYSTNYGILNGGASAGGFCGFSGNVNYCINYGIVHSINTAGGMVGVLTNGTYTYRGNINYGTISARGVAAGLYGTRTVTLNLENCANYGTVGTTMGNIGIGDMAAAQSGHTLTLNETNCVSSGYIGYSDELIADVDLFYVPDITDIYEIVIDGTYEVETFGTNGASNDPKTYTSIPKGVFQKIDESVADPKVLKISNAEGMRLFSVLINNYEDAEKGLGMTFYLANDIDMTGYTYTWTDITLAAENTFVPIGWARDAGEGALPDAVAFKGNFNGLGHSINNLLLKNSGANDNAGHRGVFGKVYEGVVANLIIDDSCKMDAGTGIATVIAGVASSSNIATFSNVWNQMNINNGATDQVTRMGAGIVAHATSTFVANATNSGWINAMKRVGGIIAYGNGRVTVANCRNIGDIVSCRASSNQTAGGIQGFVSGVSFFKNLENYGSVTVNLRNAGGILGDISGTAALYDNCANYGKLTTAEGFTGNAIAGTGTINAGDLSNASGMHKDYEEDMLKVWYQTNAEGSVRLVTTIDGLLYDKLVLTITNAEGKVAIVELNNVYENILAGAINSAVVDASEYGASTSRYFGTITLTNTAGQTFTVQATAYLNGAVVHTGAARTIAVPETY